MILPLFDSHHCVELVGGNFVQAKRNSHLDRRPQINRPAQELSGLGVLPGVQTIERAFLAAAPIVGRVRAEIHVAQLFAPQCPINQEAQGGLVRPLRS